MTQHFLTEHLGQHTQVMYTHIHATPVTTAKSQYTELV